MAGFADCIRSAQRQGMLSDDEADGLIRRYEEHAEARRASGESDVEAGAKAAMIKEAEDLAATKKAVADGAKEVRDTIAAELKSYRVPYGRDKGKPDVFTAAMNVYEHFGFGAGVSSVAGLAQAKYNLAIGGMSDMLSTFRRTAGLGNRMNKPLAEDVAREILGQSTTSKEAKAFAAATSDTVEKLRQDFNKAARHEAIGKLDYGYLPQNPNAQKMLEAKYETWRNDQRQWFEPNPDPITGAPMTPERLESALKSTWRRVVTDGGIDREPSAQPFGRGALANQRSDHRFWHPKDADSWIAWNKKYGDGDPVVAIFNHIKGMTKDIAMMERLGPNPAATTEWIKQVVKKEVEKHIVGDETLYTPASYHINPESSLPFRIQSMYDYLRGDEVVSKKIATFVGSTRNVLTSAQLGGTSILAAAQDPFIDMAARHLSGIPMGRAITDIASALSKEKRDIAVRAGLGLDDFLHIMNDEVRYAGALGGSETTRWMADRMVHWNGLAPITQSRKHGFGLDFMGAVADHAGHSYDDLNPMLRRTMADYGITEKDWDKLRAVDVFHPSPESAGILRPADVAAKSQKLAERYLEMILGQTERAVPSGTIRSKSLVGGAFQRGTVMGEIAQSGLQYKNFSLSFTTLQLQALQMEMAGGSAAGLAAAGGAMVARGAAYAGSTAFVLTMGGALAMQIQNIVATKDIQDMTTAKFWIAALAKGGGFGIMGDFLFADFSRFGHSVIETAAGPMIGLMADIVDTPIRLIQKGTKELDEKGEIRKTNPGREAVRMIGRYTPFGTLPYIRAAYRRIFLDQLQYLIDPEAHKHFRDQERRLTRETGQGYFWRPGETSPDRGPEFSAARR